MSFWNCVNDAIDEGSIDKTRGERAQAMWAELRDRYQRQGHDRNKAEALAAEDVKAAFRKAAGDERHVALAKLGAMRKMQADVARSKAPDMIRRMERLDYQHRGLVRLYQGRLSEVLKQHSRDFFGNVRNAAGLRDIVRELHGEATGNPSARALAEGIKTTLEDMRLAFNEAGGLIGKLEDWGLPHIHDRKAITRAGFDRWFDQIADRINWSKIEDRLTGKPMAAPGASPPPEVQREFLKEVYANIAYGREVDTPTYGRPKGVATYKKHVDQRVLHFKTADDWIEYNRQFGTGDPFKSLMGHVHRMARDIVHMREFGPNPNLGAEYRGDLVKQKFAGNEKMFDKATADVNTGLRMFRVHSGSVIADSAVQDWIATFMSSTRHVLTSAFLDRAIIASLSDMNTMRLAAQSIGMNPGNVISKQLGLMKSLSKDELARAGWVADTMADAGTTMARFQQEVAPSDIAERLSSAAMKAQGLTFWTDRARATFYQEMSGFVASQAGRSFTDLDEPVRRLFERHFITPEDWDAFRDPAGFFTAGNGATFAMPIHWREATGLDREVADDIFFKFQGAFEEQMELAVPTNSLLGRAFVDPTAFGAPPGSLLYEVAKSGAMFKSFAITFTINQIRQMMSNPTIAGRVGYGINLAAGATVLGAISIQINEMLMGRDPQDMTNPSFWARATLKGGGFGIFGDIASTGTASWGGGFPSYIAGPVWSAVDDAFDLTTAAAFGEEGDFVKTLARLGKRYTPLGQTVAVGPALDRLLWDQLQLFLDPESADALVTAAKKRANLYGSGDFWMPGKVAPSRGPNLMNAIGQ